jgi:hypothetical protein
LGTADTGDLGFSGIGVYLDSDCRALAVDWKLHKGRQQCPSNYGPYFSNRKRPLRRAYRRQHRQVEYRSFRGITILGYNGTGKFVSIDGVDGGILYGETRLPAPTLIGEKANIKKIPTAKEFVILLEQRVPRDIVDHILKILAAKQTAKFMLSSLNVRASFPPKDTRQINCFDLAR